MANQTVKLIFQLVIIAVLLGATNLYAQRGGGFSPSSYYKAHIAQIDWSSHEDNDIIFGAGYGYRFFDLNNVFNFYGEGELDYNEDYYTVGLSLILELVIYDVVAISLRPHYGFVFGSGDSEDDWNAQGILVGLRFGGIERLKLEFGNYDHKFEHGTADGSYLGLSYMF